MKSEKDVLEEKHRRFQKALERVLSKHKAAVRMTPAAVLALIKLFNALPGFFSDLNRISIRDPKFVQSLTEEDVLTAFREVGIREVLEE